MPESIESVLKTFAGTLLNDELLELYLNPLYLFPIVGVIFCGVLVYAFGFKSTTSTPPTLHLLVDENDKKNQTAIKKERKKEKREAKSSKPQANGVVSNSSKVESPKKTPKSSTTTTNAPATSAVTAETVVAKKEKRKTTNTNDKPKQAKESQNSLEDEDTSAGEWVQLLSRKEKKSRKGKEDIIKPEEAAKLTAKEKTLSPKKSNKKGKENKDANVAPTSSPNLDKKEEKKLESTNAIINNDNLGKESSISSGTPLVTNAIAPDDLIAEDPEQYAFEKEQRISKKRIKQQKNRRNSENENSKPVEPANIELDNAYVKPVTDKITANVVASYEGSSNDSKNNSNVSNKKKKAPKKKKEESGKVDTEEQSIQETVPIAIVESLTAAKVNGIPSVEIEVKNELKEEEEFKVHTSKKRRVRRE